VESQSFLFEKSKKKTTVRGGEVEQIGQVVFVGGHKWWGRWPLPRRVAHDMDEGTLAGCGTMIETQKSEDEVLLPCFLSGENGCKGRTACVYRSGETPRKKQLWAVSFRQCHGDRCGGGTRPFGVFPDVEVASRRKKTEKKKEEEGRRKRKTDHKDWSPVFKEG